MRSIEVSDPRQKALNQVTNAVESAWFGGVGTQYGTTINGHSVSIFNSADGCFGSTTLEVKVDGVVVASAAGQNAASQALIDAPGLVPAPVASVEPVRSSARC